MKSLFLVAGIFALAVTGICAELPRPLDKANVLPLALDDHFQFRKVKSFLNDPKTFKATDNPMILFERQRINFGAVTDTDKKLREGHYFTFFWRVSGRADVTVRFEYRQEKLGAYVQAREVAYKDVHGSGKTSFSIIGDDYRDEGRITAWRAVLIEDGKIVGLTQSYLWN